MKILILGVSGLIGHQLLKKLNPYFKVYGTLSKSKKYYNNLTLFESDNIIDRVDANNFLLIIDLLNDLNPDVILNCIGVTKRKENILNPLISIKINSLFPHELAAWSIKNKKRLIHFSTDCVFNGIKGNYNEKSIPNAKDIYGKTKSLGEVIDNHNLTIRSSFIGHELFGKTELLDWFLSNKKQSIKGYKNVLYSGVSTIYMSEIIKNIICDHPKINGLFHLATEKPISKYDLLLIANKEYNSQINIIKDSNIVHKPTLNGEKLKKKMSISVPTWNEMMSDLFKDYNTYN